MNIRNVLPVQNHLPRATEEGTIHLTSEQHQRSLLVIVEKLQYLTSTRKLAGQAAVGNNTSGSASLSERDQTELDYAPLLSSITTTTQTNLYGELNRSYDTLTILTQAVEVLQNDAVRLSAESVQTNSLLQAMHQQLIGLKKSVEAKDILVAGLGPNEEILQEELSSVKQKLQDMETVSYDGTLIWKVTQVSDKIADAQTERQMSIYSLPFYSSPTGYKMRARLYLYGDGNARRTHMSLFFVIVRGNYDAILKWPFNHKVTFCLYDQSGEGRHVIDSFCPDIESNSFQRPHSEMNMASGIPKFFPISMIQQACNNYVRDDTMFIKIIADFDDLPKMILPYALTFNPGLPMHIQHYMIMQELKRRQEATVTATSSTRTITHTSSD
ncbi:unnamed protein product [Didymodactylos carnosus]|uniref:MATH domain-containing protein n=1 Tax=Didymodactylos carnosus TaxID=1234261 RepID=A0A814GC69_9BILA|nr:unnamed protein product [Didymodactylos carnosus]CAF0994867.1 unnamed protein product [Didymodactylos carnosus]CAF3758216.1 unnamed protein product [Didymodactylos carnosus]CAF3766551.1 unnamed protein product [Didymodactylos carnosus]